MGNRRELLERLTRQPRLEPHVRIPHVPLDLRLRRERATESITMRPTVPERTRILGDFERLLPRVGLGDEEAVGLIAGEFI